MRSGIGKYFVAFVASLVEKKKLYNKVKWVEARQSAETLEYPKDVALNNSKGDA